MKKVFLGSAMFIIASALVLHFGGVRVLGACLIGFGLALLVVILSENI